jgi:hypothetical protein
VAAALVMMRNTIPDRGVEQGLTARAMMVISWE